MSEYFVKLKVKHAAQGTFEGTFEQAVEQLIAEVRETTGLEIEPDDYEVVLIEKQT